MTWIVEIVLICVFIFGAYYGYVSGFFKLAARPFRTIASIIFAFLVCKPVGNMLFVPVLQSSVTNYVGEFIKHNSSDRTPTVIRLAGVLFGKSELVNSGESMADIITELSLPLVVLLSSAIAFVLLFLFAKLLFSTLSNVVNRVLSGGIIGRINRAMGVVLAGILSFVLVWGIVGITDILLHSKLLVESEVVKNFQPGPIYKLMQETSLIELLLSF